MLTSMTIASLGLSIGFILGWVGRFPLFAATLGVVTAIALIIGLMGDGLWGEVLFHTVILLVTLQVGYVSQLFLGAVRRARARRRGRSVDAQPQFDCEKDAAQPLPPSVKHTR